ncbi:MAG: cell division protein FtsX [Bacteroidota bacterium]|jgi:cell division transport system permease protein
MNVLKNPSGVSNIISITLVLIVLGTLGLILSSAQKISNHLKENVEVAITLKSDSDSVSIQQFVQQLKSADYAKNVQYITKEEAAIKLQKELGENFVDFLGYNPLKPSIIISFKSNYTEKVLLKSTINRIAANPLIDDIQYQESLISELNENLKTIAIILLSFTSLLIIVAIGLINNTIRIALYSQRQIIRSMLLVGAKKNFIRKPFLIDSIRNGILGGLFSIIILLTCIYFAEQKIADLKNLIDTNTLIQVGGLLLSCGVVLSFTCTLIALNRHLKYRTNLL